MTAVARVAVLHLRTVAPYRTQGLLVCGMLFLVLARNPAGVVPSLALLLAPLIAVHPFVVADKARLETLYAVLPVSRRALVLGHYAWSLACFVATAATGTVLAEVLARIEDVSYGGRTLATILTVSWLLFAVNIAVQLPLLMWFGYARVSVLGTTMPLALVMVAVLRLHLTLGWVRDRPAVLWFAGVALLTASATLAAKAPPGPRT
ncbi:ABC-2 family transporter protein [Actinacidiphila yanglinensis]|uniref:ABC-2 family transporter protein n=1 Tax=Actinacidiphila yanglinensis TaxID=310779 RepID=A0A1H6D9B9_9ACTN|nr:ABC-2 transporter permease [Actinacidiphila yanglinensis]SEG81245.1 ABC-2 family transporter protein [Actinacidiphila yanglinensis]